MGQWFSAKADTYNDGVENGREEVGGEVEAALRLLKSGDMDFEAFVEEMQRISREYA